MQAINPDGVTIPGIAQAMLLDKNERLLLISGQVALNAAGALVGSDLETQLVQTFENMRVVLAAAKADFSNVARFTIYVCDYHPDKLPIIRGVRNRYIDPAHPPASSLIGVAALFQPGVLVEIDALAAVPA
jgi:enamine deaminase RidA (YjgF/YER057c/UK114 family)